MHQRLTTDPVRILRAYERGLLTSLGAATDLVEATLGPPTAELIARCPAEILDRIREWTRFPFYHELFLNVAGPTDAVALEAERNRWLAGISFWKACLEAGS
jgi:hypothetical protein